MNETTNDVTTVFERADAWTRYRRLWVVTYYGTLITSAIGAWLEGERQPFILALTIAIGLSQAVVFYLQWQEGGTRGRWRLTALLFVIQIAAWYALIFDFPIFYLHLFSLFSQSNGCLPRRLAWVANVVLTFGIALPQFVTFGLTWQTVLLMVVMGAVSVGFGLWIDGIIRQSSDRRRLIEQLQQTQEELAAAERREGMLEERSRLARDIHDTLAQSFIGVITHLEAAAQSKRADQAKIDYHIAQAEAVARDGLLQSRRVVHELRPRELEQNESLGEALDQIAQKWSTFSAVPVKMEVTGREIDLPPPVEMTLVRALQEALANVARHANATAVQVTLSYIGDQVALDISDNGRGFEDRPDSDNGEGYGLQAMRERLSPFNGELHIESDPSEGVNLAIVIPI